MWFFPYCFRGEEMSEYNYRVKKVKLGEKEHFEIIGVGDIMKDYCHCYLEIGESLKELRKKLNAALDATYKEVL
jgi:hypothetical protein